MGLTKKQIVTVTVLLVGTVLAVLDLSFLSPALPSIMADFNVDATTAQWLSSAYSLVEAIIIPLSAYLLGRFSTKKLFLGAMSLFVVGSLLAAWGPSFGVVLTGRVFQAACTGILLPMVMTEIVLIFPRERRGSAMGLIGLLIGFAPTIGPTISGLLVDSVGWHVLFLIVGTLGAIVLIASTFVLEDKGTLERTPFDTLSVVLSSLGLLCVLYGLSTFSSSSNIAATIALVIFGLIAVALFIKRQLNLESPMLRMDVFRSRRFACAIIIIALTQGVYLGIGTVLPLFIQIVQGHTAVTSGLAVLPGALLSSVFALVSGSLFDKLGVRKPALAGGVLILVGSVMLAVMGPDASLPFIMAAYAIGVIGLQLVMTPCNTWGINSLDNSLVQHANAVSQTANQISNSFMVAIIISLTALSSVTAPGSMGVEASYAGDKAAFTGAAIILAIAFAFIILLIRNKANDRIVEPDDKSNQDCSTTNEEQPCNML